MSQPKQLLFICTKFKALKAKDKIYLFFIDQGRSQTTGRGSAKMGHKIFSKFLTIKFNKII